eukprot:403358647
MSSCITLKHRFEVQDIISQGRYASVYKCFDKKKQRYCVAKMFLNKQKSSDHYKREVEVFKKVFPRQVVRGFPKFIANGTHLKGDLDRQKKFIVMSRHGYDLSMIYKICQHRFSHKTALQIAIDMIDRLQKLHQGGYIYEDMKLSNILIALMSEQDQTTLTVCDFGDCERISVYKDQQIYQQFRDLERVFFLCIYMVKGELPWKYKAHNDILVQDQKIRVKDGQIINFLKTLDDKYLNIFKFLKNIQEKAQSKSITNQEYNYKEYTQLKDMFNLILQKHQNDTETKFDWYPILARIQKHNRKQGMGQTIASFRGSSNNGVVPSASERRAQRKATFQIPTSKQENEFLNIDIGSKFEQQSKKSNSSPTKLRSKSANIFEENNLYLVKRDENRDQDLIQPKQNYPSFNVENLEVADPQYNFLKLLEGSQEMEIKKKDSSKYLFGNKESKLGLKANESESNMKQNLLTLTQTKSSSSQNTNLNLFERTNKKSTMLLINANTANSKMDLREQQIQTNQLEDIVENSSISSESEYQNESPFMQGIKASQKKIESYFTNQDRGDKSPLYRVIPCELDEEEKSQNIQLNDILQIKTPQNRDYNPIVNMRSGLPTFKNASLNQQNPIMLSQQQQISYNQHSSSINDIQNMNNSNLHSPQIQISSNQNGSSIMQLQGYVQSSNNNLSELNIRTPHDYRKYSGMDYSRKFSVAASDLSVLTIDRYACQDYDEGVQINEVKSIKTDKVNPLQKRHSQINDSSQPLAVQQRTFMSFYIKRSNKDSL